MTRPLPTAGSELLDRFSEEVRELVLRLRDRVLAAAPHAHEIVLDAGYTISLHYGPDDRPGNAVIYIAGFSKHANLGFFDGASLADPHAVIAGTGSRMRHVRLDSLEETKAAWLGRYVKAAFRQAGLGPAIGDGMTTVMVRGATTGRSKGTPSRSRGRRAAIGPGRS